MRARRSLRLGAFLALALTSVISLAGAQSTSEPIEIHHIHGLAIDRQRPEILYVATHTGLVRLGPNAAPEWIGVPRYDLMRFTPDPRNSRVFFASGHPDLPAYQELRVGNLGVIVSSDGGRTWGSVALSGQADFHALACSAGDGGTRYGWNVTGPGALYRIAVGQWRAERLPAAGLSRVLSLAASPDPSGPVFAGTEVGLFVSHDAGSCTGLAGRRPVRGLGAVVDPPPA
jgi:hypothetical protein